MAVGVRTQDLRKVYNSAPPLGAAGGFIARADAKGSKQPKRKSRRSTGFRWRVLPGEIFGLLGPNGAGKSTTVGVLTTRVRPTSGQAWIGDHDVWKEQAQVKRLIGVVPQRPNLDFSLTAREILVFHGAYFGIASKQRNERADALLEKFKLTERGNQMVRGFSGGMMQRLSIARAMMHDPQVLFLDEPSAGLDPQTRILLWEIIREYHQAGKTILLTTHYMEEADALCQRLAIVDHGHMIALGTPAELKASIPGGFLLRLRFGKQTPNCCSACRRWLECARCALWMLPQKALDQAPERSAEERAEHAGVDVYADRGGSLIPEIANVAIECGRGIVGRSHFRAEPGESFPAPYRKEPARLNWKTFFAMLARDAHVARRNAIQLLLQTFLQPLLFVFIFGKVMVGSGYMPAAYKSLLLPGIIAISMTFTGVWAVAMPLIAEFQWTREIEDRLLAPISVGWIAIEKVIAGMLQALVAGLVVMPLAWLVLRPGVQISIGDPFTFAVIILLVAGFSSCGGLALGCSINQQHIGLMFSLVMTPMIFFGCTYYPWSALDKFPIMQKACADQPAGVCERRYARHVGSAVPASLDHGCNSGSAFL